MKTIKIIVLAIFLFGYNIYGQDRAFNASQSSNAFSNNLNVFAMQRIDKIYNGVLTAGLKGSVYLFSEFKECTIYHATKKDSYFKATANYNVYADQFEVLINNELYLLDYRSVEKIEQENHLFAPNTSNKQNRKYLDILAEGKNVSLVAIHEARFLESQTQTLGLIETKIKLVSKSFLLVDNELIKLPSNKQKIFKVLKTPNSLRSEFKNISLKNIEAIKLLISKS
jgi:hypothetical protein